MNKILSRLLLIVVSLFSSNLLFAQGADSFDETMRGSGKIYVVVAICLTILIGLFIYLFLVDRKISSLEKEGK